MCDECRTHFNESCFVSWKLLVCWTCISLKTTRLNYNIKESTAFVAAVTVAAVYSV